jgi:CHAT domain-containing protein
VARSVNNLAELYDDQGQYLKSEPLHVRALAIDEKVLGPDHPGVATDLNNLAGLYRAQGQYAKAEPLYVRALAIDEKALGPDHPDVANTLNNLAVLHFAIADLDGALRFQARADDAREAELRRNLIAGSQQAKRLYLEQTRYETDIALSIQAASGPTNAAALRMALTQVLRRKGRALDALVDQLDALARSGSPEDRRLLGELSRARAEHAALMLGGPGNKGIEQHRQDLADSAKRVDDLEAQASARSSRLRAELSPITLDGVTAAVPKGTALVEFATYRPYAAKARSLGATRYVVFTLVDGTIRWTDLGEAAQIDTAVAALRDVLRAHEDGTLSDVEAEVKPRARALDALVFAPVRKLVGTSTRLLVAPDGQLSLVPFDALVDEQGRYVTEVYEISYLSSGRDLLRLAARGESRQPAAVIANPDFGGTGAGADMSRALVLAEAQSQQQTSTPAADLLARAYFPPLRGTAAEAEALGGLLPGSRVLTGAAASKKALAALSGPRVLHLATHGFFLAGERPAAALGRGLELSSASAEVATAAQTDTEDPLLRSGLALAGANLHQGGDGILTSLEAASLDLWGTKLVVLSACDTGVGEVHNGDGVYGLRRAFVLAGSETQVMSLWPVSDLGTRDLMIGYYKRITAGEGRSEALRRMRLEFLAYPKRAHPYFWASFIVSGEWANLDGKRPE